MSRPTILIDMDGPLADFDRRYWDVATELGHNSGNPFDSKWDIQVLNEQRHRYLSDHLTDPRVEDQALRRVQASGWFESLSVVKGAATGMNTLAEVADVWVCSKPLETNPTGRDEKAAWLNRHIGADWDKRLILASDKSVIRGDVLLDDAIKPEWVPSAEWKPVVFDAPFNQPSTKHGQDWQRFTWADGIEKLLELAL